MNEKKVAPKSVWGKRCFVIVENRWFDRGITLCVVLNVFVMMLGFYGESASWGSSLNNLNGIFVAIFNIEFLVKVYGLRIQYFALPTGHSAESQNHDGSDGSSHSNAVAPRDSPSPGEDDSDNRGSQVTAEGDGKEKRRPSKKQHYSFQWWNIFDFFIVLGTDLGLVFVAASDEGAAAGPIATAVRVR